MHLKDLITGFLQVLPFSEAFRSSGNAALADAGMAIKRVAVIGAGAGGSSAAYHLSQYAKDAGISANISVFERSSHIGGRTTTVHAWDDPQVPVELGGSIFVEVNHILVNATKAFNLSTADFDRPAPNGTPELGIWNGKEFLITAKDGWWDKAKLLWRYGLAPLKTNSLMKSTVGKFLRMYEEPLFPWRSLSEVAKEVGLTDITGVTGEQYLKAQGIGEKFAKEMVQASTRVNYASNLGLIHGLETMVCMATSGAMSIEGGNWQIFSHMLKASADTTTHLNTTVSKISKQIDNTYHLTTDSDETSTFDTIILAAPLQFSKLVIDPAPKHVPDQIPYVNLHVTLFASPHELDPTAFSLKPGEKVPQFILTTLPEGEDHGSDPNGVGTPGFFSISIVNSALNPHSTPPYRPEYIYKIFSPAPVSFKFLSKILGQDVTPEGDDEKGEKWDPNGPVSWIHQHLWQSYPYEYPRVTFEEVKLDDGLWYTSGIESFISTMETSALSGKNVAKLVVDEWSVEKNASLGKQDGDPDLKVQGEKEWKFEGVGSEKQKPIKAKL